MVNYGSSGVKESFLRACVEHPVGEQMEKTLTEQENYGVVSEVNVKILQGMHLCFNCRALPPHEDDCLWGINGGSFGWGAIVYKLQHCGDGNMLAPGKNLECIEYMDATEESIRQWWIPSS